MTASGIPLAGVLRCVKKMLDFLSLKLLRRIEIRFRLINSFILVSLLPLLIAGVIAYRESSNASQEKIRIFAGEVVKQVAQNMLQQIEKIETSSEELIISDRMQDALSAYYSGNAAGRAEARATITGLLLESFGSFRYVSQKYVLDRHRNIMDPQGFGQLGGDIARFVDSAPDMHWPPYWTVYSGPSGQKNIVMLREIISKSNNRWAGTLFIGVQPSHFARIFESANLGYGSRMLVVDRLDGSVVASRTNAGRDEVPVEDGLAAAFARGDRFFTSYVDKRGKKQLAVFARVPRTTWMVVNITPFDGLNAEVRSIRNKIILIGVLCFVVSLVLSFIIARSISLPLRKLVSVMKTARSGNYLIRADQGGEDEITLLSQRFNEMAGTVHQHSEQLEQMVAARTRELEQANRKLETLSSTDSLTGIANRRRFDEALLAELRRASRSQKSLALLMLDVDFFKNYNDRYGHPAGDDCLRTIGHVLGAGSRRATDLAARYGGEEFAVIVAENASGQAMQLAESIRAMIAARQIPHEDSPFGCVTCSIGVAALLINDDVRGETLVQMADIALYRAKSQGRNCVVLNEGPEPDTKSAGKKNSPA